MSKETRDIRWSYMSNAELIKELKFQRGFALFFACTSVGMGVLLLILT